MTSRNLRFEGVTRITPNEVYLYVSTGGKQPRHTILSPTTMAECAVAILLDSSLALSEQWQVPLLGTYIPGLLNRLIQGREKNGETTVSYEPFVASMSLFANHCFTITNSFTPVW